MKSKAQRYLFLITIIIPSIAYGQALSPLKIRERVYTDFRETAESLTKVQRKDALKTWVTATLAHPQSRTDFASAFQKLTERIPNKLWLELIIHYGMTEQHANFARAVEFFYFNLAVFANQLARDEFVNEGSLKDRARQISAANPWQSLAQLGQCLENARGDIAARVIGCTDQMQWPAKAVDLLKQATIFGRNLDYLGPAFVSEFAGSIGGNKVLQWTENSYGPEMISYLADKLNLFYRDLGRNKPYFQYRKEDFRADLGTLPPNPQSFLNRFFTSEEGFPNEFADKNSPGFHKSYSNLTFDSHAPNMFGVIYDQIRQAKHSIFIDVFFLGGSMGVFLSKALIAMKMENPELKIFILSDQENPLGYRNELDPVFGYLAAFYDAWGKDHAFYALNPNVFLKDTALPELMDFIISDEILKEVVTSEFAPTIIKSLGSYPKAKSDHSKVLVIDGLDPTRAVAFVGSKNFTDSSGALAYDEMTEIRGPAVGAILDSYYYDMLEALLQDFAAREGAYRPNQRDRAKKILEPWDVLGRSRTGGEISYQKQGSTTITIGQNDVYGFSRSAIDQDIRVLSQARRQIIISDQFVFDPAIISTLVESARKGVKIYLLLESQVDPLKRGTAQVQELAHIPNIVFLPDLNWTGKVAMKWKNVPQSHWQALQAANRINPNIAMAPEYHLKAISIDGVAPEARHSCSSPQGQAELAQQLASPYLISGSANKDNFTLRGGFREFQIGFSDGVATVEHDCHFWARWDSPELSEPIDLNTLFAVPASLQSRLTAVDIKTMLHNLLVNGYNLRIEPIPVPSR